MNKIEKTRGFEAPSSLLKPIENFLKESIQQKKIQSIPIDIKKFIQDIEQVQSNSTRIFSPERAIKLRGIFIAFFAINDIVPSKEMTELLNGFRSIKTLGDAAVYFSDAYDKIYLMLDKYPFREFSEAKLYFVDQEARNTLVKMNKELNSLISKETEKRKLKFSKIVNFLNPENVSNRYSVTYKSKYQYISKEKSLKHYLPAHFQITLNKIEKEYRELFEAHTFSEKKKQQLKVKKEQEIQKVKDEYKYITTEMEEGNELDVKILSYEHSSLYPEIKYSETLVLDDGLKHKTKYAHLRSEVVNVLWYKPSQLKESNTVADILQNYNHAFGDVYYLEKQ